MLVWLPCDTAVWCRLAGQKYGAWIYIASGHMEAKKAPQERKEDVALLKTLMRRSRIPLAVIHSTQAIPPAQCKVCFTS